MKAIWLAIALVALAFFLVPVLEPGTALDIGVYHDAAARWRNGWSAYQDGIHLQFKYSPFCTWLFSLVFTDEPVERSYGAYRILAILAWVGLAVPALKRAPLAALGCFAIAAPSIAEEIKLGQMNALVLIACALAAYCIHDRRERSEARLSAAGALFAIAVGFKLFAAIWVPVLWVRREYRMLAWAAFWFVALNLGFPAAALGAGRAFSELGLWFKHLWSSSSELLASRYNASLIGVALKLGFSGAFVRFLWISGCVLWLAGVWRAREVWRERVWEGAAFSALMVLILNPLVWSYWVWLALPALWLARGRWTFFRVGVWVGLWIAGWAHHSYWVRDGWLLVASLGVVGLSWPLRTAPVACGRSSTKYL